MKELISLYGSQNPTQPIPHQNGQTIDYWLAEVRQATDYSPFGVQLQTRNLFLSVLGNEGYRFGFNGMEADPEVKGQGNSYTTEFRQYDPRLGRWLTLDPLAPFAPSWTPYRYGFDNPLVFTDMNGLFESKDKAKEYKKSNKIKGRIQKDVEGTGFAINSKSGVSYSSGDDSGMYGDSHKNDDVVESAMVKPNKAIGGNSGVSESNSNSWLNGANLNVFRNGFTRPINLSKNPFEDDIDLQSPYVQEQWKRQRAKSDAMDKLVLGHFSLIAVPFVAGGAVITAPTWLPAISTGGKYAFIGKMGLNYTTESISSTSLNPLNHNALSYGFAVLTPGLSMTKQISIGTSSGLVEYNINDNKLKGIWNQNFAITSLKIINGATSPFLGGWYGGILRQGVGGNGINQLDIYMNKK